MISGIGFGGGASLPVRLPLEQSFPVLRWEPRGGPSRGLRTSGSYSQLARDKFL